MAIKGIDRKFYRKIVSNGLTVIFERRETPVVSVCCATRFGAQNESMQIKGISHFIEHLVFKGTKNRNVKRIAEDIESKGGIINAFTGEEITCFWNKLPSKYFRTGIDVARDLVLNPVFNNEALERERKVILEEIKMYHDNPSSYVIEKIKEMMYEKPFGVSIAGTIESVTGLKREDVIRVYNKAYQTKNMIMIVVGECSWEEVQKEAELFPDKGIALEPVIIREKNSNIEETRKGIDQAHMVLGFHMPKIDSNKRYASMIFDSVLGNGMSSRLFQEIREKKGLCYAIRSCLEQSKDYSYELVYCGTVKEKVNEVRELIIKEINKISEITSAELEEAKEKLIGLRQISKEKCDSTMIDLLQEELGGNAENYYRFEEGIRKVSLSEVRELGKIREHSYCCLLPE